MGIPLKIFLLRLNLELEALLTEVVNALLAATCTLDKDSTLVSDHSWRVDPS